MKPAHLQRAFEGGDGRLAVVKRQRQQKSAQNIKKPLQRNRHPRGQPAVVQQRVKEGGERIKLDYLVAEVGSIERLLSAQQLFQTARAISKSGGKIFPTASAEFHEV